MWRLVWNIMENENFDSAAAIWEMIEELAEE